MLVVLFVIIFHTTLACIICVTPYNVWRLFFALNINANSDMKFCSINYGCNTCKQISEIIP